MEAINSFVEPEHTPFSDSRSYPCLIVAEGQALCNSQGGSTRMEILAHWTLLGVLSTVYAAWGLVHCISHVRAAAPHRYFNFNIGWKISPLSHTPIIMVAVE
jgi:hypothetical protein